MNDIVKQRIVGSVVVLAILAIFVPVIFHQPGSMPTQSIPVMPKVPAVPVPNSMPASTRKPAINEHELKSAMELPAAWVIVLGSFSQPAHAATLVKHLRKEGLPAYTRVIGQSSQLLTRVYVGPTLKRADANKLQVSLHKKFHLNGLIRKYQP